MTRPGPPDSTTSEDGSRFYDIDGDPYWSVTTALSIIGKEGLTWWAAGLAADYAFTQLPKLTAASITAPCGRTHNVCKQNRGDNAHDWRITCPTCPCGVCRDCVYETMRRLHIVKRDERADEGSRVHDWIEHWVLNDGAQLPVHDDTIAYVRAFLAFVQGFGLTPDSWLFTEATVVNREHRYAGTTDGALRFCADTTDLAAQVVARVLQLPLSEVTRAKATVDVIFDVKTKAPLAEGKSVRLYPTVALQMGGYRWAPVIRLKTTGEERPMPQLDGAMAVLLYPDYAAPRLCVSDAGTFHAFLHALNLYRWNVEHGSASVAEKSFPLPPEPKPAAVQTGPVEVGGATVRAPGTRKAAKKAAPKVTDVELPPADAQQAARARAAAKSSATVASMLNPPAHPKSPFGDHIPF